MGDRGDIFISSHKGQVDGATMHEEDDYWEQIYDKHAQTWGVSSATLI
jgi:hypothetical protein